MPQRTPKACRARGCRKTTIDPSGYCAEHKGQGWKSYKSGLSRHQRGYGSQWEVIRARILKRDKGLCALCISVGIFTPAVCVDHIVPLAHGGTSGDTNLQALCTACHTRKTAREGQPQSAGERPLRRQTGCQGGR